VRPATAVSWESLAACRGAPTGLFYPDADEDPAAALSYCAGCPVTGECFEAFADDDQAVAGGFTGAQRAAMARGELVVGPPVVTNTALSRTTTNGALIGEAVPVVAATEWRTCVICDTGFATTTTTVCCTDRCRARKARRDARARLPFRCDDCNQGFATADTLSDHGCVAKLLSSADKAAHAARRARDDLGRFTPGSAA